MSDIVNSYIGKAIHIYDSTPKLQKLSKEKADRLQKISNYRDHLIQNVGMINQFKNISGDICQVIDGGNFDLKDVS